MRSLLTLTGFVIVILHSSLTWSAAIKVKKAKGKKATVVFQGMTPETGEVYQITSDEGEDEVSDTSTSSGDSGSREKTLSLGGGFTSLENTSGFGISARYGWNKKTLEYGGIFAFHSGSAGVTGVAVNDAFALGGFLDYNLTPNRPGTTGIIALAGQGLYYSGSESTITIGGGGSYKWFGLGNATCIRADAFVNMSTYSSGSIMTMSIGLGLQTYF
jgi:hypothetical protein